MKSEDWLKLSIPTKNDGLVMISDWYKAKIENEKKYEFSVEHVNRFGERVFFKIIQLELKNGEKPNSAGACEMADSIIFFLSITSKMAKNETDYDLAKNDKVCFFKLDGDTGELTFSREYELDPNITFTGFHQFPYTVWETPLIPYRSKHFVLSSEVYYLSESDEELHRSNLMMMVTDELDIVWCKSYSRPEDHFKKFSSFRSIPLVDPNDWSIMSYGWIMTHDANLESRYPTIDQMKNFFFYIQEIDPSSGEIVGNNKYFQLDELHYPGVTFTLRFFPSDETGVVFGTLQNSIFKYDKKKDEIKWCKGRSNYREPIKVVFYNGEVGPDGSIMIIGQEMDVRGIENDLWKKDMNYMKHFISKISPLGEVEWKKLLQITNLTEPSYRHSHSDNYEEDVPIIPEPFIILFESTKGVRDSGYILSAEIELRTGFYYHISEEEEGGPGIGRVSSFESSTTIVMKVDQDLLFDDSVSHHKNNDCGFGYGGQHWDLDKTCYLEGRPSKAQMANLVINFFDHELIPSEDQNPDLVIFDPHEDEEYYSVRNSVCIRKEKKSQHSEKSKFHSDRHSKEGSSGESYTIYYKALISTFIIIILVLGLNRLIPRE